MKLLSLFVLPAVVAAFGLRTTADAAQIMTAPSAFSTPFVVGAMPVQGTVPMFDPVLGTLNHVTLTVLMEVNGAAAILTNTDQQNPAFVFGDKFDFIIEAFGVQDLDNPSPIFPALLALGTIAPGQSVGLVQGSRPDDSFQSQTITLTAPARYYVGYGMAPVFVNARYGLNVFSGSLRLDVTAGTFSGSVSATYDYTPAVVTAPEPGTAAAACLGTLLESGILLCLRRRPSAPSSGSKAGGSWCPSIA